MIKKKLIENILQNNSIDKSDISSAILNTIFFIPSIGLAIPGLILSLPAFGTLMILDSAGKNPFNLGLP